MSREMKFKDGCLPYNGMAKTVERLFQKGSKQFKGKRWTEAEKSFWDAFHAFYLHRNKLTLTVAYKMAFTKTQRDFPDAKLPTISQARGNIGKLDQGLITFTREGFEATKEHYISMLKRERPRSGVSIKTVSDTGGREKTGEGLTDNERCVLKTVAEKTQECMVWEEEAGEYRGNYEAWLLALSKEDFIDLCSAIEKL